MTAALAQVTAAAWERILVRLRTPGNEATVKLWLARVHPQGVEDGALLLECPNALFQVTIQDRRVAMPLLEAAGAELGVELREVRCRVSGAALRQHQAGVEKARHAAAEAAIPAAPRATGHGYKRLSDFVVGRCNRLAYDAVNSILDNPAGAVNPLFIHGASGLGKTHLQQGLFAAFREQHPHGKALYIRCEQFTNEFLRALEDHRLPAFRVRMRHPDLLLIDDIHFLSKGTKEKTKDELFATFDELQSQGKKVVIASDASPRDIQYLEERFVQRFAGGLVVGLERPDPEVRREVLLLRARSQGVELGDEVVEYVADHITDNVRLLEGAVNKLVQFSRSFGRRIDMAAARHALADLVGGPAGEDLHAAVVREVAAHYGLAAKDLARGARAGQRAQARHVAMYVFKLASGQTYAEVGRAFGLGHHTSVSHACEQATGLRAAEPALDGFIEDLLLRLRHR